jgi:protein-S-isoprenylcysteine O-methyltransferase Ste14
MNTQSNLQRWERYAEWPLAAAALLFLGLFSVQVLARPQGREAYVLWLDSWIVWVGVVTAALAWWIIERVSEEKAVIQTATAAHIEELRGEIRELSEELRGRGQR